jgi:drug/metabolite transporter (DMT)-like permease
MDQVVAVSVGGLFGAVALISITSAMAFTSVASANAINTLQVGIAPLVSWLLVGESMSVATAAGITLIMAGVIVVQRARLAGEQGPAEPDPG